MVQAVAQFFGIIGLDFVPPTDMASLIPYLLTVFVGLFLVSLVFRVVVGLFRAIFGYWRT